MAFLGDTSVTFFENGDEIGPEELDGPPFDFFILDRRLDDYVQDFLDQQYPGRFDFGLMAYDDGTLHDIQSTSDEPVQIPPFEEQVDGVAYKAEFSPLTFRQEGGRRRKMKGKPKKKQTRRRKPSRKLRRRKTRRVR